jgi:hypothetical protein
VGRAPNISDVDAPCRNFFGMSHSSVEFLSHWRLAYRAVRTRHRSEESRPRTLTPEFRSLVRTKRHPSSNPLLASRLHRAKPSAGRPRSTHLPPAPEPGVSTPSPALRGKANTSPMSFSCHDCGQCACNSRVKMLVCAAWGSGRVVPPTNPVSSTGSDRARVRCRRPSLHIGHFSFALWRPPHIRPGHARDAARNSRPPWHLCPGSHSRL